MIVIIQELHRLKNYKVETLFVASTIADVYLAYLADKNERIPNLVNFATISILIAAKLEEAVSPSFNRMIGLLKVEQRLAVTKEILIALEFKIITSLQMNLTFQTVVPFLERFIRMTNIKSEVATQI